MNMPLSVPTDFYGYRRTFVSAFRNILQQSEPGLLDEAAFPAYSHPNPIINWIYWQRLKAVTSEIAKGGKIDKVLDFGCGSGVLLPFLARYANSVTGMDLDVGPVLKMRQYIQFPENIEVIDLNISNLDDQLENSFDLITALNVLEHIEDPAPIIARFVSLLKTKGKLIVSLPKENKLYNTARKLAGKEFTGEYHATTYMEVEKLCQPYGDLKYLLKNSPFSHILRIFSVTKN